MPVNFIAGVVSRAPSDGNNTDSSELVMSQASGSRPAVNTANASVDEADVADSGPAEKDPPSATGSSTASKTDETVSSAAQTDSHGDGPSGVPPSGQFPAPARALPATAPHPTSTRVTGSGRHPLPTSAPHSASNTAGVTGSGRHSKRPAGEPQSPPGAKHRRLMDNVPKTRSIVGGAPGKAGGAVIQPIPGGGSDRKSVV